MNNSKKLMIIVLGAPKSGVSLLKHCLNLLGLNVYPVQSEANEQEDNVNIICDDLFTALNFDLNKASNFPEVWLKSDAAEKAKKAIAGLLHDLDFSRGPWVIGSAKIVKILPLWLKVLAEFDVEVKFIHILRHPWEVAKALEQTEGLELDSGHKLWLAFFRDVLNVTKCKKIINIIFEELHSNPIFTLQRLKNQLGITFPATLLNGFKALFSVYDVINKEPLKNHLELNNIRCEGNIVQNKSNYKQNQLLEHNRTKNKHNCLVSPDINFKSYIRQFYAKNMNQKESETYSVFINLYNQKVLKGKANLYIESNNPTNAGRPVNSFCIRTIHHLSCTGGTVISKCIAAMPSIIFLSELHPCISIAPLRFNPFDPLEHFQKNYTDINYQSETDLQLIFMERLENVVKKCKANSKNLVIRDHSHSDFLISGVSSKNYLLESLASYYPVLPVVTIRNPIDSYLSLKSAKFTTDVTSFDEYCERVLQFIGRYAFAELFLYEDFVDDPDNFLKRICDLLRIEFDPDYRKLYYEVKLTGDSGRGKDFMEIKKLERREYSKEFEKEVLESRNFKTISERYGYEF